MVVAAVITVAVAEDVVIQSILALVKMLFVLVADYLILITTTSFNLVSTACAYIHIHFSGYENITKYIQSQQI